MKKKIIHACVECKVDIPSYQRVPLCAECYQEMLTFKIREDDKK